MNARIEPPLAALFALVLAACGRPAAPAGRAQAARPSGRTPTVLAPDTQPAAEVVAPTSACGQPVSADTPSLYCKLHDMKELEALRGLSLGTLEIVLEPRPDTTSPADLTRLPRMPKLTRLYVKNLDSLAGIERHTGVRLLSVSSLSLVDLGALAAADWVEDFQLASGRADLKPLAALRNLERLDINLEKGMALPDLGALSKLEVLRVSGEGDFDLRVISGLKALRRLEVSVPVTGLLHAATLSGLKQLELRLDQPTSLFPVTSLVDLTALGLSGPGVRSLAQLAHMRLSYVTLFETKVTDLTPLAKPGLEELHVIRTPLTTIKPLARASSLRSLRLYETRVTDLSPLQKLPDLREVLLRETPVSSASLKALARSRTDVTVVAEK